MHYCTTVGWDLEALVNCGGIQQLDCVQGHSDCVTSCHPGLNLKVGKMNYSLDNLDPIWTICSKSGQNFSRSGQNKFIHALIDQQSGAAVDAGNACWRAYCSFNHSSRQEEQRSNQVRKLEACWKQKPQNPLNWNPKGASKQEVRVDVGSLRCVTNYTVEWKCQVHISVLENISRKSYLSR